MLDFVKVNARKLKNGTHEIAPKFIAMKSKDLMIRGRDFYAVWNEDTNMWSTDEDDVIRLIDKKLREHYEEKREMYDRDGYQILYMWDCDTGSIDKFHKYCQKQCRDNYHMLDEELIFSNTELTRDSYASKRLNYPLEAGSIESYDKLIGTLYSKEERHKIEWAIGSIVSGDSKTIQSSWCYMVQPVRVNQQF